MLYHITSISYNHHTDIYPLSKNKHSYRRHDLSLRRQDVLSAWSGVRPLAVDPFLPQTKGEVVSRDHVIGVDPISKAVFVTGGKWTTYVGRVLHA